MFTESISFNDVPKAMAHLINKVDKIETLLITKQIHAQGNVQDADEQWEIENPIPYLKIKPLLENWIDNHDVMKALHISARTLQTLRSNGSLPYSRIGKKTYYQKSDIVKLLAANYDHYKSNIYENK